MTKAEQQIEVAKKLQELEDKKNGVTHYWGGTTSNQTREADRAAKAARDKEYYDRQKQKDTLALANKTLDVEAEKAEATLANANAVAQAKNRTALEVANIRANGGALGRRDPSVLSANERMQAALKIQEQNSLPGKPMPIDDAVREVDRINGGQSQITKNADGTIAAAETPEQRAQRQALVPGHKNDPRGYAVDPSTIGISTPKGEAPTALTDKQWQQYADSKSPGMKYEGNQPGMIGDQIARFKRPDGSTFFANTGAAKMQMGDALTQTPVTPLDNTPGSVPRATMPDAANRSAMNTAKAVPQKETGLINPEASGTARVGWNALAPVVSSAIKNTNWTDATMGAGMTRDTGEEPSIQRPDNYDKAKALNNSLMQDLPAYTGTRPEIAVPAPETSKTQDLLNWFANAAVKHAKPLKENPTNLLSWLKDRKKHYMASASR